MTGPITDEKILQEMKEHRRNIILSLYRHGEVGAGDLWKINGVPRGSKEHHYSTLQEWGLIEQVGTQQNKGGNPERLFALTDDGTEFAEEYLVDTDAAPDAYALKIDRALDETEELRGLVEKQARTIDDLRSENERLEDEVEDLNERFETFMDRVESEIL